MNPAMTLLAATQPSDLGGARAANRLHYQRDWVLCKILELHEAGRDYLVVCDYHDDVLVLDASASCSQVDFYQIKTKQKGQLTLNRLLKRKKLKASLAPSILGKLFAHRLRFPGVVSGTTLVTDKPPKLEAKSPPPIDQRTQFTAVDVAANQQTQILAALNAELATSGTLKLDATLAFEVSNLPIAEHATFAKGRLAEFLDRADPNESHPVAALYRAVVDEIDRRSDDERVCTSPDDLFKHKCVSRAMFGDVLAHCLRMRRDETSRRVSGALRLALQPLGVGAIAVRSLCQAVMRHEIQRIGGDNRYRILIRKAAEWIASAPPSDPRTTLEILEAGCSVLRALSESQALSDEDLKAIVAWELFDESKTTSAQSEEDSQ